MLPNPRSNVQETMTAEYSEFFSELTSLYEILTKAVSIKDQSFWDICLQNLGTASEALQMGFYWYDCDASCYVAHSTVWHEGRLQPGAAPVKISFHRLAVIQKMIQEVGYYYADHTDPSLNPLLCELSIQGDVGAFLLAPVSEEAQMAGFVYAAWVKPIKEFSNSFLHCILSASNVIALRKALDSKSQKAKDALWLVNYMFDKAPMPIYQINLKSLRFTRVNEHSCQVSGYTEEELLRMNPIDFLTPTSKKHFDDIVLDLNEGRSKPPAAEFEIRTKSGYLEWGNFYFFHIYEKGELWGANVAVHIITEQKKAREDLAEQGRKLEALVQERTSELSQANQKLREEVIRRTETAKELRLKSERLKELNTAMRVLLDKRSEDRLRSEENIRVNLVQLIEPYLDRLNNSGLNKEQHQLLDVIKMNLVDVVGEPMPELSAKYYIFSPSELQVANLIRNGKTTKDIARMLNLSPRTVESYRNSIRKKLGLKNKKVNLKTFLSFKE